MSADAPAVPRDDPASLAELDAHVPAWRRPFLALESPDFRHLWIGTLPSGMAMQMGGVTTGYVAYDITRSAAAVGIVSLATGLPLLVFGLFGGVVADRYPKRNVLLLTQSLQACVAALNAMLVISGAVQIWHLVVTSAFFGLGMAFNMPARHTFVMQLVRRERVMNAVALNHAGVNFARVVGPSIAGGLIAVPSIGSGGVYVVMVAMFLFVIFRLTRISHRGDPVGVSTESPLRSIRAGLAYVHGAPIVSTLLLLAFIPVVLGMPYQALMPVFAADVFDVGPAGLGALMAASGIGALIGSLAIASLTGYARKGLLQMALGMLFGLSLAAFAFSGSFIVALLTLLVIGGASAGYQSLNNTLVMNHAEPAYRGRVMSITLLTFAATPLAVVPIGFLTDAFGAPTVIGVAGLLLLASIALVGLLHPTYRHIN